MSFAFLSGQNRNAYTTRLQTPTVAPGEQSPTADEIITNSCLFCRWFFPFSYCRIWSGHHSSLHRLPAQIGSGCIELSATAAAAVCLDRSSRKRTTDHLTLFLLHLLFITLLVIGSSEHRKCRSGKPQSYRVRSSAITEPRRTGPRWNGEEVTRHVLHEYWDGPVVAAEEKGHLPAVLAGRQAAETELRAEDSGRGRSARSARHPRSERFDGLPSTSCATSASAGRLTTTTITTTTTAQSDGHPGASQVPGRSRHSATLFTDAPRTTPSAAAATAAPSSFGVAPDAVTSDHSQLARFTGAEREPEQHQHATDTGLIQVVLQQRSSADRWRQQRWWWW